MKDIPEDILRTAKQVVFEGASKTFSFDVFSMRVAQAIAEERERCVKIVEDATVTVFMHWDEEHTQPIKRPVEYRDVIARQMWGGE